MASEFFLHLFGVPNLGGYIKAVASMITSKSTINPPLFSRYKIYFSPVRFVIMLHYYNEYLFYIFSGISKEDELSHHPRTRTGGFTE